MIPDRAIDRIAARQLGAFSLAQARTAGFTDRMIQGRVETATWLRVAPRTFVLRSSQPTWMRQVAAAVLSREQALVSGSTAAVLHGFEGFRPGRPEITVPATSSSRSSLARVVRTKRFLEIALTKRFGIPVASEAETFLALAGRLSPNHLERLLDSRINARSIRLTTFDDLWSTLISGRVAGGRVLGELLNERSADAWEPPGTELERQLDLMLDEPRIPVATRQTPIHLHRPSAVDRFIPAWQLIVEADGRRWHTRRIDFETDRARDNAAAAQGLAVLRFTWRMLTTDIAGCQQTLLDTGLRRAAFIGEPTTGEFISLSGTR